MNMAGRIENYLLIGDQFSAALVSKEGSIDWLCLPYFDSSSLFGRVLDPHGGYFDIDTSDYDVSCDYVQETAIVERTLQTSDTKIKMKDYMVPRSKEDVGGPQYLVRSIEGVEGRAEISFRFCPKPQYGSVQPDIQIINGALEFSIDTHLARLHIPADSHLDKIEDGYKITVALQSGEKKQVVLEYQTQTAESKVSDQLEAFTYNYWQQWIKKGTFDTLCRDEMIRSAIALKLMQFAPTGAMVAAPTTSLPEEIGGVRNWDYRYTWIRDATFTLYAFKVLGYTSEAREFFKYLRDILEKCNQDNFDVSLMYTIHGEPVPAEETIDYLAGYKNSKPVRIGNDAADQFQLDVYGALIDAYYFAVHNNIADEHQEHARTLVMNLVRKISENWMKKDSGIWEVRSGAQHYTYSKVMCWVGADRAVRLSDQLGFSDEDKKVCTELAGSIYDWIWQNCYSQETQNFTQHPQTKHADATNFLFVLLQFLNKHDTRTADILARTQKDLCHQDVFVFRYQADDGLPGKEGAFILCSFWLISALAIMEDTDQSFELFRKMESFIAPHGLIAEEIDPDSKEYLGNYPQAFSHLGYILSAHYLHKYLSRKGQIE